MYYVDENQSHQFMKTTLGLYTQLPAGGGGFLPSLSVAAVGGLGFWMILDWSCMSVSPSAVFSSFWNSSRNL